MKTQRYYFAAAMLMFMACQAETPENVLQEQVEGIKTEAEKVIPPEIIASQEAEKSTKSLLDVDELGHGSIYWTPADEINVFYGTTSTRYVSKNTENATTAVFKTTDVIGISESSSENIWGLYPYDEGATCTGSSVNTTLPATQYGVSGTFDDDLFITLAHNTSTALVFYNVCGGIKFSLSRDDITEITFRGNNNEDIAGDISLAFSEGLPTVSVSSGVKEITLTPKTGGTFASGEYYYIIALPTILTGGFTMTFETNTEIGTFNYTSNAVTIKRSVFSKKTSIDTFASFTASPKVHCNQITYTSTDHNIITPNNPDAFGANIISNTYSDGKGIIEFDDDITSIGADAFKNCSTLASIEIPKGVNSIGDYAFFFCQNMTSAVIPEGVSSIGARAFMQCNELVSINIPDGVISIGEYAFYSSACLHSSFDLVIPDSVMSMGQQAFAWTNIKSVVLPDGITSIEDHLFAGCRYLASVDIPDSVTSIGPYAFFRGEYITSITIPAGVTYIGEYAFTNCYSLTSFRILAVTPPQAENNIFYNTNCAIYVPAESVNAYKQATNWSTYASRIQAIP